MYKRQAYIFLAIILAPALVGQGLNPLAAHLFILYWAMLSYITPPVALGAYSAASIAQASALRTGVSAMRMGSVLYIIPFIFVLDNAFLMDGSSVMVIQVVSEALLGIFLIAGALQGFLPFYRRLNSVFVRIFIFVAGLLVAVPGLNVFGVQKVGNTELAIIGAVFLLLGIVWDRSTRKVEE